MPSSRLEITTTITRRLAAAAALVALAAGCNPDEPATGPRPTGPSFRLRVVNATPDPTAGGAQNVKIGDQVFAANLGYGAGSSYQRVYEGQRELHVRRTSDTTIVVTDAAFSNAPDLDFTTFVVGKRTANGGTGIVAHQIPDDNTPPAAGQVKLRFFNAAAVAGNVDVYVTSPTASILTATPNVSALAYRTASPYLALAAGTYRVRVTTAGTKTVLVDITQTAGTSPPTPVVPALPALAAGQIRTIVVLERTGSGTPLTASILVDRNP